MYFLKFYLLLIKKNHLPIKEKQDYLLLSGNYLQEVEVALADHKIRTDTNKELQEERKLHQKDIELGLKQQQVTNQKNKNNNN